MPDLIADHHEGSYINMSLDIFLISWICHYGIGRVAADVLIKYLKGNPDAALLNSCRALPNSCRTLLSSQRKVNKINMSGGYYVHFGILKCLQRCEVLPTNVVDPTIILDFNVDGLEIAKGAKSSMWPIQGLIRNSKSKPFVVGLFYGKHKPVDFDEFLKPFVDDMNKLMATPQFIHGKHFEIKLGRFIFDAPARSSCCGIKAVNGYFGCPVCKVKGHFSE